ncbi:hypothetical protein [Kutzneria kofuensis]|uniref:Uncharacterized protein n=1 Tax=Kutzneria kofuensis TaxID=103725 RepID=A0A7W9NF94_9PSEU|nr:hypothetical protein [Kutzneria kofuensis]MBB5890465.1 hypothetical protein [Kutzneria kofuensis]
MRRRPELPFDLDNPDLNVVAEAFDPAEADSAVLARSPRLRPAEKAVLRHHLVLPASSVDRARELLAQDGWELRVVEAGDPVRLHALRVQLITALSCAQERSRMAGLAQRLDARRGGMGLLADLKV